MAVKREAKLKDLRCAGGWKYDGEAGLKLVSSVRRYGQLRPVVVRTGGDGELWVVDGRRLVAAMLEAGHETAEVKHIGKKSEAEAHMVALALEVGFEVDYAKLAVAVAALVSDGATPDQLASASPFSPDRIKHFVTLAAFDWSQYDEKPEDQHAIDWDAMVALPAADEADLPAVPDMPAPPAPEPAAPAPPADDEQMGLF